jgi:anti-anti-sigma factor
MQGSRPRLFGDADGAMDVRSFPNGDGHIVKITGDLTAPEHPSRVVTSVQRVIDREAPTLIKLDVHDVEVIDLDGIAAVMKARQLTVRSGAGFKFVDAQPRVRNRLMTTGLLRLLEEGVL